MKLLFLLDFLLLFFSAFSSSSVPLLLFGGSKYWRGGAAVSSSDLRSFGCLLGSLSQPNTKPQCPDSQLNSLLETSEKPQVPEVVVGFAFSHFRTDEFSRALGSYSSHSTKIPFEHLKAQFEAAPSSLSVSFLQVPASESSATVEALPLPSLLASHFGNPVATFRPDMRGQDISTDIMSFLEAHSSMLHNNRPELILVQFDSHDDLPLKDAALSRVVQWISAQTEGRFLAVVSANSPTAPSNPVASKQLDPVSFFEHSLMRTAATSSNSSSNSTSSSTATGPQYINSIILFGLFMGAFFVITIYIASTTLLGIETPVRLTSKPVNITKVY